MKALRILIARWRLNSANRRFDAALSEYGAAKDRFDYETMRREAALAGFYAETDSLANISFFWAQDDPRFWHHLPARTVRQLAAAGIHPPQQPTQTHDTLPAGRCLDRVRPDS